MCVLGFGNVPPGVSKEKGMWKNKYILGLNMTQDQESLGLIHPCLHKQKKKRIPAFYHKSEIQEEYGEFSLAGFSPGLQF